MTSYDHGGWKRRFPLSLAALLGALGMTLLLLLSGLGDRLELATLDLRFRLRPAPDRPSPVTLVVLRGQLEGSSGRPARDDLARLLTGLAELPLERRPRAVVVDLLLSLPDPGGAPDANLPDPASATGAILKSQAVLGTVVHAMDLALRAHDLRDGPRDLSPLEPFQLPADVPHAAGAYGVRLAHPAFADPLYRTAAAVGYTNLSARAPREDARLHSIPLLARYQPPSEEGAPPSPARVYPSLALAGAAVSLCGGVPLASCLVPEGNVIRLEGNQGRVIPIDPVTGELWIDHRHRFATTPAGGEHTAPDRPASPPDVLLFEPAEGSSQALTTSDGARSLPLTVLEGRTVLVVDGHEPLSILSPLGAHHAQGSIHAQVMANLLEEDFLVLPPRSTPWIVAVLLLGLALSIRRSGAAAGAVLSLRRTTGQASPAASARWLERLLPLPELILAGTWCLVAHALFVVSSLWLPVVLPCAAVAGGFLGWRWRYPAQLKQEAEALAGLLERQEALIGSLRERTDALAADREQLEEDLEAARARLTLSPEGQAALTVPVGELETIDRTLEESSRFLAFHRLPAARSHARPGAGSTGEVLERLRAARVDVERLRRELEAVQGQLNTLRPALEDYRRFYETRVRGYQQMIGHLQGALREAVREMARLTDPVTVEEPPPLEPLDEELLASTGCVTRDPRLIRILVEVTSRIARSEAPVLVLGETGTGKELIARAVHTHSPRRARRFIAVNCGAFSPGLLESELFGHVKGAFTGADRDREGLFVEADGGTLFLDELGEMPLEMQTRLLRVLESGEVQPVGAPRSACRRVDVRLVAATHADLRQRVERKQFREDLFFRLNTLIVSLPPLRERRGDILLLATHFLQAECRALDRTLSLEPEALQRLETGHTWPGNVRELRGFMRRLATMADGPVVTVREVQRFLNQGFQVAPLRDDSAIFDERERERLQLQREHRFSATRCEEDPRYGAGRQAASRHLRVWMARALWATGWTPDAAVRLLAGPDEELQALVRKSLETFLENLQERLRAVPREGTLEDLMTSLKTHYRADHEHIARVVEALREGWLKLERPIPG